MDQEKTLKEYKIFCDFIDNADYRVRSWFDERLGEDFKRYMKSDFYHYLMQKNILEDTNVQ